MLFIEIDVAFDLIRSNQTCLYPHEIKANYK